MCVAPFDRLRTVRQAHHEGKGEVSPYVPWKLPPASRSDGSYYTLLIKQGIEARIFEHRASGAGADSLSNHEGAWLLPLKWIVPV
jgi:hypothetical protein